MQASLGRVKTNTSTKTALSLPISHVCLSVTSESWKESLSYSSSREKSLVLLDAPAHPILQCAFPEASTTNHKSAGIALSYGDGITISVRPIDLCEATLAKQKEIKCSRLTLQSCRLQRRSNKNHVELVLRPGMQNMTLPFHFLFLLSLPYGDR